MITVMDAPCGAGKSTWAIKYINSNPQVNFIVITPFLKEVERYAIVTGNQRRNIRNSRVSIDS